MDWLSGGHFVLGLGLGYRDEEYTAFGVSLRHRAERLEEGWSSSAGSGPRTG